MGMSTILNVSKFVLMFIDLKNPRCYVLSLRIPLHMYLELVEKHWNHETSGVVLSPKSQDGFI